MSNTHPILYSFRRCPYAMRARLALLLSGLEVELREVILRSKPNEMLELSPKGTVPVLLTSQGQVVEESLDIMYWALNQNDPNNLLCQGDSQTQTVIASLIDHNDHVFKTHLDRYKYFDRHPEQLQSFYREQGEETLRALEARLNHQRCLCGDNPSLADYAIVPFIRQFAHVDREWFYSAEYPALQAWLNHFLESGTFKRVMKKYPQWEAESPVTCFPES